MLGVEPLHCLDQADRRHLFEVLHGLAPPGEPAGQVAGDPRIAVEQDVPRRSVGEGDKEL